MTTKTTIVQHLVLTYVHSGSSRCSTWKFTKYVPHGSDQDLYLESRKCHQWRCTMMVKLVTFWNVHLSQFVSTGSSVSPPNVNLTSLCVGSKGVLAFKHTLVFPTTWARPRGPTSWQSPFHQSQVAIRQIWTLELNLPKPSSDCQHRTQDLSWYNCCNVMHCLPNHFENTK